ncbi:hypothetical protein V7S43_010089 [Phytophthora oleae]|uniref:Uncharacterized protein n=1 Tax=Phytophthora oleae TaxID=2107226 RepID=A0ABD3FG99_9STRA
MILETLRRWTSCSRELKKAKQFSYEHFDSSSMGRRRWELRSHQERYREAVRETHLIANEMADIEDETKVSEMLMFVLNQWINIRQKKRASTPTVVNAAASSTVVTVSREEDDMIKQEFGISSSDEKDMISAAESEEEGEHRDDSGSDSNSGAKPVKIRLNPKARKVGRPRKLNKKTVAGEKADRKWFEAAEAGRKKAGEVTLKSLMDALDHEQPSLVETQRRLSGVVVKYSEAEKKKPKFKRIKNPVLILDPFYILPQKRLDACIAEDLRAARHGYAQVVDRRRYSVADS